MRGAQQMLAIPGRPPIECTCTDATAGGIAAARISALIPIAKRHARARMTQLQVLHEGRVATLTLIAREEVEPELEQLFARVQDSSRFVDRRS